VNDDDSRDGGGLHIVLTTNTAYRKSCRKANKAIVESRYMSVAIVHSQTYPAIFLGHANDRTGHPTN